MYEDTRENKESGGGSNKYCIYGLDYSEHYMDYNAIQVLKKKTNQKGKK